LAGQPSAKRLMVVQKSETIVSMVASNEETGGDVQLTMAEDDDPGYRLSSEELADELGLPMNIVQPALVGYRSVGIGLFGAIMRWGGMVRCRTMTW